MRKLACYWPDGTDILNGMGVEQGWYGGTDVSRRRNGSATIGSWGADGGGKWWLAPIVSVLKGRGVFVSEHQNNTNRLHINRN